MAKTITESTQDSDSIELSRNAKGQYSWTVKIYGMDAKEMQTRLSLIDESLKHAYSALVEEKHGD